MNKLIELDRELLLWLNGSDSLWLDEVMWAFSDTLTWIPLLLTLIYVVWHRQGWRYLLLFALTVGLSIALADQVSSSLMKPFFQRFRPTHDPVLAPLIDIVRDYRGGTYGFVSSHAANTFAVCSLVSSIFRSRFLTLGLISWASLASYSRIYLGVHYPGDILGGLMLGLSVGMGCYGAFCLLARSQWVTCGAGSKGAASWAFAPSDTRLLLGVLGLTYLGVFTKAALLAYWG